MIAEEQCLVSVKRLIMMHAVPGEGCCQCSTVLWSSIDRTVPGFTGPLSLNHTQHITVRAHHMIRPNRVFRTAFIQDTAA